MRHTYIVKCYSGQQMFPKLRVAAVFVLLTSGQVFAQEQCNKSISEAPSIAGIKLGMSFEDVRQSLGGVMKMKPPKNGEGTIYLSFAEQTPPENLRDIGTLWVRLFENTVYQVEVFYSGNAEHKNVKVFTNGLSTDFRVPDAAWKIKSDFAVLECGEFFIKADALLNPHIELTDKARKAEFDKKHAAEKAKKKS